MPMRGRELHLLMATWGPESPSTSSWRSFGSVPALILSVTPPHSPHPPSTCHRQAGEAAKGTRGRRHGAPNSFGGTHISTHQGETQSMAHIRSAEGRLVCERVERRETHRPNRERHRETHGGFETHTDRHVEERGL